MAVLVAAALLSVASVVGATDIYKWVDAEGVPHYSQLPPVERVPGLETVEIATGNPADWDPGEYDYSILNQAQRTEERMAAAEEEGREESEKLSGATVSPPVPWAPDPYDSPDRYYYYPQVLPFRGHRDVHGGFRPPLRITDQNPGRSQPAHRFDFGDRFAHPARSHRRLGADKRFGYLAHRFTHRQPRRTLNEE